MGQMYRHTVDEIVEQREVSDSEVEGTAEETVENQETMNETELARKLGVSRKCLWERRQRLGIPRKKASSSN